MAVGDPPAASMTSWRPSDNPRRIRRARRAGSHGRWWPGLRNSSTNVDGFANTSMAVWRLRRTATRRIHPTAFRRRLREEWPRNVPIRVAGTGPMARASCRSVVVGVRRGCTTTSPPFPEWPGTRRHVRWGCGRWPGQRSWAQFVAVFVDDDQVVGVPGDGDDPAVVQPVVIGTQQHQVVQLGRARRPPSAGCDEHATLGWTRTPGPRKWGGGAPGPGAAAD